MVTTPMMTTKISTMTTTAAPATEGGTSSLRSREAALFDRLRALPSLVVAYSGGVDSAYLAWAAHEALGARALAVTADSESYPERHRAMALSIAAKVGLPHELIQTHEMARPGYRANGPDRCYHCKHELYSTLTELARSRGFSAVADGNNADDRGDYRPGRKAAREFGVLSPLDEADLTKADIRELSREAGLECWDEPASACLSSRIPYYSEVTDEKLRQIEQAEAAIRALGFRVIRVRHHGDLARLELARDEMPRALEPATADVIDRQLKALGFKFVTVDVKGYRTGSLNEAIVLKQI
jgi:uncharacterized protein